MAYSAPELLLVGAAQNLVLETSGPQLKDIGLCEVVLPDVDSISPLDYEEIQGW